MEVRILDADWRLPHRGNEVVESFCTGGTSSQKLPIRVYDTATNALLGTIPADQTSGAGFAGVAFSRDGRTLYAGAAAASAIDVINARSKRITGSIPVPSPGQLPTSVRPLVLGPNGNVLYGGGLAVLPPSEFLVVPLSKR
jgi:DNA-binding beta-propeller fold protein YncE